MNPLNLIVLVGRLAADPEMRTTASGIAVTSFRLAVDRPYRKGKEREADFFTIECWRNLAPYVHKNFTKGKPISVIGSGKTESYIDKDNVKRTAFKVVAEEVSFVPGEVKKAGSAPVDLPPADDADVPPDDVPPFNDADVPPIASDYMPPGESDLDF